MLHLKNKKHMNGHGTIRMVSVQDKTATRKSGIEMKSTAQSINLDAAKLH
jgi:hypothetical protein